MATTIHPSTNPRRPARFCNASLQCKATVFSVVVVVATTGAVLTSMAWQTHRDEVKELSEEAYSFAEIITHTVEPAILVGDRTTLDRIMKGAGIVDSLLVAQLVSPSGELLSAFRRKDASEARFETATNTTTRVRLKNLT